PGGGRWYPDLLLDGMVGLGGAPAAVRGGAAQLLAPGGLLLAEAAPYEIDERLLVRIADARGATGGDFPWARLGTNALLACARPLGLRPAGRWTAAGRPFVALRRG
ncbi:SAM-dependent methyltransferase, partial [Streptomyces sp. NPDC059928]